MIKIRGNSVKLNEKHKDNNELKTESEKNKNFNFIDKEDFGGCLFGNAGTEKDSTKIDASNQNSNEIHVSKSQVMQDDTINLAPVNNNTIKQAVNSKHSIDEASVEDAPTAETSSMEMSFVNSTFTVKRSIKHDPSSFTSATIYNQDKKAIKRLIGSIEKFFDFSAT